uniref:Transmembrane protein 194A n=1 Tax=Anthurium amnicola TaxID=1678845 RepID=A0A1D1YB26_9ARAE
MLPRPSSPSETVATMRRPADAPAVSPRSQLWIPLAFLVFWIPPLLVSCDELAVALHPAKVRLPPGQLVEGSPGSKPGAALSCSRVHIRGVSRLRHLNRLFHSLKVKVDLVPTDGGSRIPTAEVCLHRNASTGVGMCPPGGWQKLSRGSWAQSISPFQDKILDLRMQPSQSSTAVDVSTEEEFFLYRVVFLIMGFALMAFARILSESVVFYYGSAMAVGIILVVLVVLFQGMRLLPTGRKSSLAIFMYSSVVGVGTFLLHYLYGLLRSALVEMGISEDIHKPLGIFFLLCLFLVGAWLGFWGVHKLVLDEEGSVDQSIAYFVEWSILIFAAALILQSSLDILLATEALLLGIVIASTMRSSRKLRFLRRLYRRIARFIRRTQIKNSPFNYSPTDLRRTLKTESASQAKPFTIASCSTTVAGHLSGSTKTSSQSPVEGQTYYSTFHVTPERKKFSNEEWKAFTRDSTRRAMEELSSSPDFARWVATNAERITVTPNNDDAKTDRQFCW